MSDPFPMKPIENFTLLFALMMPDVLIIAKSINGNKKLYNKTIVDCQIIGYKLDTHDNRIPILTSAYHLSQYWYSLVDIISYQMTK